MGGASSAEIGGVRVFKVSPNSPAAEAGLEFFFDFIMEINGAKMEENYQDTFATEIQKSENGAAKLVVYSTRAHTTREVSVRPRKWGGSGLLGATVRFDNVEAAEHQGIRVLEVFPNSPAAHAGLLPFQDFLLGTAQTVFHDLDELSEVVSLHLGKPMQVYVYNADTETVRDVSLAPNNEWGGEGCIGCDIGVGLLHRIPQPRRPLGSVAGNLVLPPTAAAPPPAVVNMSQTAFVGAVPATPGAPLPPLGTPLPEVTLGIAPATPATTPVTQVTPVAPAAMAAPSSSVPIGTPPVALAATPVAHIVPAASAALVAEVAPAAPAQTSDVAAAPEPPLAPIPLL